MRKTGYPAAARCWRSRAAREGSSYHVRVSLCRSGMMIYRQSKLDDAASDLDSVAPRVGRTNLPARYRPCLLQADGASGEARRIQIAR